MVFLCLRFLTMVSEIQLYIHLYVTNTIHIVQRDIILDACCHGGYKGNQIFIPVIILTLPGGILVSMATQILLPR